MSGVDGISTVAGVTTTVLDVATPDAVAAEEACADVGGSVVDAGAPEAGVAEECCAAASSGVRVREPVSDATAPGDPEPAGGETAGSCVGLCAPSRLGTAATRVARSSSSSPRASASDRTVWG